MTMSIIEKVLFLRGVDLFAEMYSEDLVPIAEIAQEERFHAGEAFIEQGEHGDSLYVIVDGAATVVVDGVGEIARRGPRSIIGEMAVISQAPRSAHVIAETDVTALRVDHDAFWELLHHHPKIATGTVKVLAKRLGESVESLAKFSGSSMSHNT